MGEDPKPRKTSGDGRFIAGVISALGADGKKEVSDLKSLLLKSLAQFHTAGANSGIIY